MDEFYKYYFIALAKASPDLLHTDAEPSYFFVEDKYDTDAFDIAIKSFAKTPAILLEQFSSDLDDNNNENHFEHVNGRFSIVVKAENGNRGSIEEVKMRAKRIAKELIFRMRRDFKDGGFIELPDTRRRQVFFKIQKVQIDPLGPMNIDYYGVTIGFIWRCPLSVTVTPGYWTDI